MGYCVTCGRIASKRPVCSEIATEGLVAVLAKHPFAIILFLYVLSFSPHERWLNFRTFAVYFVMRTYTVKLAALTVHAPYRWVDTLLSRHPLPGVAKTRQGIERRVTDEGLLAIELCRMLNLELGVSLEASSHIARDALAARSDDAAVHMTASGLSLTFPIRNIERRLRDSLADAIESIAHVPRGRPRRV
jgi:hypothetical protein